MAKTRTAPPQHRTKEPSHDLARRGPEPASGQVTPSGPQTDRSPERALRGRPGVAAQSGRPSEGGEQRRIEKALENPP